MTSGLAWSERFIREDMADKTFRDEFVADQIRLRIATLIRALREQPDRDWSQTELGNRMGKLQSVVSRIEDPDYGKLSLQTLLEVAAAFDLPLWVDIPEWEDWLTWINDVPNSRTTRRSFDVEVLCRTPIKAQPLPTVAPISENPYIAHNQFLIGQKIFAYDPTNQTGYTLGTLNRGQGVFIGSQIDAPAQMEQGYTHWKQNMEQSQRPGSVAA